jgi:hypothetical protein
MSIRTQKFIPRFNLPLRLVYVLVVEVTTKVGVSFTSMPLSTNHKGKPEFFARKLRVIQTFQDSPTDRDILGDA